MEVASEAEKNRRKGNKTGARGKRHEVYFVEVAGAN
jgi:hypothetical protein